MPKLPSKFNKNKRGFSPLLVVIILGIITVISWLAYQSLTSKDQVEIKTSGLPMKVARYNWPGEYWIEIADKKGWFEEAGLDVELVDTNSDYYQSLQEMVDGKMDVNNFSLFDIINYNADGADLVLVINADNSYGADALVAKKKVKSIEDLRGETIGVGVGSYTEYILDIVLERNGLSPDDVSKVDVPGEKAAQEFAKGELDAMIVWEPVAGKIVEESGAHKIFDTTEIPGISPNGQVFHASFIKERPEDVQAYVNVWSKTTKFIMDNPDEAFGIIAEIYGVTADEVSEFAEIDKILGIKENKTAFSYAAGFESLHGAARRINDFMVESGLTDELLDSTNFIESKFINRVK